MNVMRAGLDTGYGHIGLRPLPAHLGLGKHSLGHSYPRVDSRVSFHAAASLFALTMLAACASTTPAVRTEIVEVATPVPVACVAAKDIPNEPGRLGKLPLDARAALDLTAAKLIEVRLYGRTLAALLIACAQEDIAR